MLEDYVGLENLASSLPENHKLLPVGYYTFQFWELLGYFVNFSVIVRKCTLSYGELKIVTSQFLRREMML